MLLGLPLAIFFVVTVGLSVTADAPPPGTGIDGLMPPPDIRHGNQATFAEKYPAAVYNVHLDAPQAVLGVITDPVGESATVVENVIASIFTTAFVSIGVLTTRFVEWMFTFDLVRAVGGLVNAVVSGLAGTVYSGLIAGMLAVVGLWLGYQLWRHRYTVFWEGAIWAFVAVCVAGVFIKAPADLVSGLNGATTAVAQEVLASVDSNDPALAGRGGNGAVAGGPASDAALRVFADRYWHTFVFIPWSVVEFGNIADGQRYGEEYLKKQSNQPNNFDAQFASAPKFTQDWYAGKYPLDRIAVAVAAFLVSIVAALLLIPAAGMMLVAQVAQVALSMVGPLFLLVGVLPGYGRRLMGRWVELILGASLIRVFMSAFLSVMLVIIGAVSVNAGLAYLVVAAIDVALLVLFFMLRRPFMGVFGQAVHPQFAGGHVSNPTLERHGHRGLGWAHGKLSERLSSDGSPQVLEGQSVGAQAEPKLAALEAVQSKAASRAGAAATAAKATQVVAGAEGAAVSGATAATGVGAAALVALKGGQAAIRGSYEVRRKVQRLADPFVFGGNGGNGNLRLRDARDGVSGPPKQLPSARPRQLTGSNGNGGHQEPEAAAGSLVPITPRTTGSQADPPPSADLPRHVTLVKNGDSWDFYNPDHSQHPMSGFHSREVAMDWADYQGWVVDEEHYGDESW